MKLSNGIRAAALVLAVAAAPAFAAGDKALERADKVMGEAKVTLSQAISTAETQVGGKAIMARLAWRHDQNFYDVHVLKGNELMDVRVGIDDGKVISTGPLERHHHAADKSMKKEGEQPANKS